MPMARGRPYRFPRHRLERVVVRASDKNYRVRNLTKVPPGVAFI
jgi:hypothetical protein